MNRPTCSENCMEPGHISIDLATGIETHIMHIQQREEDHNTLASLMQFHGYTSFPVFCFLQTMARSRSEGEFHTLLEVYSDMLIEESAR
jgi:hypothetical protein